MVFSPAWSLDILWIPFSRKLRSIAHFAPHEVPLSVFSPRMIVPGEALDAAGAHRSIAAYSVPQLTSSKVEFGWGLGVSVVWHLNSNCRQQPAHYELALPRPRRGKWRLPFRPRIFG